jgi:hypothetical protein
MYTVSTLCVRIYDNLFPILEGVRPSPPGSAPGIVLTITCSAIVLSVVFWFMGSDYLFGILKLVLHINKTDRHDIAKILLKVALNTINPKSKPSYDIRSEVIL